MGLRPSTLTAYAAQRWSRQLREPVATGRFMRKAYHEQLVTVTGRLVGMIRKTGDQIRSATTALLEADLKLAETVLAGDRDINRDQLEIDEEVLELMATQGPVATELREVTAALRTTADAERMGDLAVHVAKVARRRYPEHAVEIATSVRYLVTGEIEWADGIPAR